MLKENLSPKEYPEAFPPAQQATAKSKFFNTLSVNSSLSILYAACFLCTGRNPFSAKNLQARSEFFFDPHLTHNQLKGK
jgi:hypothetical protein